METIRQINGRWWSQDNRQLTQRKDVSWLWTIQNKRVEGVVFHHHWPVDLSLAESLHLFMSRDAVRALLGDPNETWDRNGFWWYYAANGTALFVRFLGDKANELGEARYERPEYGVSGRPVASIEKELAGRSIHKIMADRAWQRSSPESYEESKRSEPHPATLPPGTAERVRAATAARAEARGFTVPRRVQTQVAPVTSAAPVSGSAERAPEPPRRRIAANLVEAVKTGMTRAEVVKNLGEPGGYFRITGSDKAVETLTYDLDSGATASIRLEDGKVTRITQ